MTHTESESDRERTGTTNEASTDGTSDGSTVGHRELLAASGSLSAAYGVQRSDSELIERAVPLTLMPPFLPPVVLGVALLVFFGSFSLHRTYLSIVVAHSLWATPISFLVLQSVLAQVDWSLRDAALDLGASPSRTFLEVLVPQIKEGLIASIPIAFVISIREFAMTLFLAGEDTQMIPVLARRSISQVLDPVVNVVSTLLIVVVVVLLLAASLVGLDRIARRLRVRGASLSRDRPVVLGSLGHRRTI